MPAPARPAGHFASLARRGGHAVREFAAGLGKRALLTGSVSLGTGALIGFTTYEAVQAFPEKAITILGVGAVGTIASGLIGVFNYLGAGVDKLVNGWSGPLLPAPNQQARRFGFWSRVVGANVAGLACSMALTNTIMPTVNAMQQSLDTKQPFFRVVPDPAEKPKP